MSENKVSDETVPDTKRGSSGLAFTLVITMLGILLIFVVMILYIPYAKIDDIDTITDFYKWALSVLLGAFGAWIGAGAAYFFGKENLRESSESTETAMKIQQKAFERGSQVDRIKDMTLVAMNPNFIFNKENQKKEVRDKLNTYKGYWFVPVVDGNTGVLQDVIHANIFWGSDFNDDLKLSEIIEAMDKDSTLKNFHGGAFFVKVGADDTISNVYNNMTQTGAEIGIVVDQKGKATHCITKTELRTLLKSNV